MKKAAHTTEFLFGIHWGIWKTNSYLKNLLKWVNKKQDNFDIYYVAFKKKWRKTPVDIIVKISMMWSAVPEL